jgi:hypothetical protein
MRYQSDFLVTWGPSNWKENDFILPINKWLYN